MNGMFCMTIQNTQNLTLHLEIRLIYPLQFSSDQPHPSQWNSYYLNAYRWNKLATYSLL